MGSYQKSLDAEAKSWVEPDVGVPEKLLRERIRHYKLIKDLMLDKLPTQEMALLDVGGGPLPLSDLLPFKSRIVVDPCTPSYRKIAPCTHHVEAQIESFNLKNKELFDLVICTNALDHVEDPDEAIRNMIRLLKRGGYMAILCPENNAITHPHEAHIHNLDPAWVHRHLDEDFETIWELNYLKDGFRYGWVMYEGKRGQPAWAILARKC